MSCPGLHCPGCTGGQSLGIAAGVLLGLVVAAETLQWVAQRVWWIGSTMAVCFALAIAASIWLERRADRRGAAWGAARGIYSRADMVLPYPAVAPPSLTINIFGVPSPEQAAIMRQALPGAAEDVIADGEP